VIRVLLVTHFYPEHGSGIEIVAGALAERLARREAVIEWAASDLSSRPSCQNGACDGSITRLPMPAWNWAERRLGVPYPIWGPSGLLRLARAVARCDVVHLHDSLYCGNFAAYLFARLARKPVIVTQHIGLIPYRSQLLRALMTAANGSVGRAVLTGAQRCVFISAQVRDFFLHRLRFRRPPDFIANGVDTAVFHPLDAAERLCTRARLGWPVDRPVLLFVGRFVEKKGLPLLRALAAQFPECLWVFVGWGPDDPSRWGLANVQSLGSRPQHAIASCYQAADLLVLPSVGEGFPLVVQEAMACGTPALIGADTARGAPGVESYVVTAELTSDALERQLRAVLPTLNRRRHEVAAFARDHWDWDRCADRYWKVYKDLVPFSPSAGSHGSGR
jgi:glycosyltransferase involved in cell wall biosynthesis